jgi:hypothetical protein
MMKNEAKKKRKRCPNYFPGEKTLLLNTQMYNTVHKNIANQKTHVVSSEEKSQRLSKIAKDFNNQNLGSRYTDFF